MTQVKINKSREKLLNQCFLNPHIVQAKGNQLTLENGEVVLDFLSQYGALPFGHNCDELVKAVHEHLQTEAPIFVQPTLNRQAQKLANRLSELLGGHYQYCTFTNSGAETVEAAIKLARLKTKRGAILSAKNGFHGKTFSALSATGSERFKGNHIVDRSLFHQVEFNDIDSLSQSLATGIYAAFIVEPIQGEGGMNVATHEYIQAAISLCKQYGTLLVLDEVQTGLGRTGYMSAAQYYGAIPDILLLAKALGGGIVASGAMLYRQSAYTSEFDRKHSSTFANNGLAASAGLAVLEKLEQNGGEALRYVQEISEQIDRHCIQLAEQYPRLFGYQGAGLMRAFQIYNPSAQQNILFNYAQNSGALAYVICGYLLNRERVFTMPLLSQPCSIRFEPPLNVTSDDINYFFNALARVCRLIEFGRYDILMSYLIGKPEHELSESSLRYPVSSDGPIAFKETLETDKTYGKKFAFLMHSTSISDVVYIMPVAIHREYTSVEKEAIAKWIMDIGAVDYTPDVAVQFTVKGQQSVSDGMLIFSPISAEAMLRLSPNEKHNLMNDYLEVARSEGAEVVGLGAYTSVITRGGETIAHETRDLCLTTGNSLTAMATLESIKSLFGNDSTQRTAVIIGARGSVGKLIVYGLAHQFGKVILVGRKGSEQMVLRELLYELLHLAVCTEQMIVPGSVLSQALAWLTQASENQLQTLKQLVADPTWLAQSVEQLVTSDTCHMLGLWANSCYGEVLPLADCVVSATSEGKPFLNSAYLRFNAVAFDTARPFDFIRSKDCEANIFEGGLVNQPELLIYSDCNMVNAPVGVNLACLSETIALALDNADGHYSIGKTLDYSQARIILELARTHGFSPVTYAQMKKNS